MEPGTSAMPTSEVSPPARLVDDQSTGDGQTTRLPPLKSTLSKILADKPLVPYESVPCANIDAQDRQCTKNGNSKCGGCALVLYCSQTCQREHWKTHKKDCKSPLRSIAWNPRWVAEGRVPGFDDQEGPGRNLWSILPAMDTLNLAMNEGPMSIDRDFAIAYPASGDIRNVVQTVNALPKDYSGHLTVLLSDMDGIIVGRNLLLLAVLGSIDDIAQAAEIALHLWYSAFIRPTHADVLSQIILRIMEQFVKGDSVSVKLWKQVLSADSFSMQLGEHSILKGALARYPPSNNPSHPNGGLCCAQTHLMDFQAFHIKLKERGLKEELNHALKSMQDVRFDPSRADFHDSRGCYLEQPSHRLADLKFRKMGTVLPFGADNGDFYIPNRTMFSADGKWLSKDTADPLGSWNIDDVVRVGQARGAQPEDLYGCLYFYLSDQLRTFAERLKHFRITFHLLDSPSPAMSGDIRAGTLEQLGLPKTMTFDRIDVSTEIDTNVPHVFADWAPLLSNTNPHATIVGHFLAWTRRGDPPLSSIDEIMARLYEEQAFHYRSVATVMALKKYLYARWENSGSFAEYLEQRNTKQAAEKAGVRLKHKHTVVPHRVCTPIDGAANMLPVFKDKNSMYLNICVASTPMSERFVEFRRV